MINLLCALPPLRVKGYLAALPAAIRRENRELGYRAYVTDSLQAIGENTHFLAAMFSENGAGKHLGSRWVELFEAPGAQVQARTREETRSPDEVVDHMLNKLKAYSPG